MALPTGWATMDSTSMAGVKTVSTLGFTFQIYPYTNNVGQIINSALENEKINIQYKIVDTTNYNATVNPAHNLRRHVRCCPLRCLTFFGRSLPLHRPQAAFTRWVLG